MNTNKQLLCFEKEKQRFASKLDLSRKGSIDDLICDLIKYLNSFPNYYSTSSCSGRLILISKQDEKDKKNIKFLMVCHSCFNDVDFFIKMIQEDSNNCVFKFESAILHVCCDNLKSAQKLLSVGIQSGFKNSGITISKKERIIVAIRSTLGLEIPLSFNGHLLVTREYIEFLLNIANQKLMENTQRIERLFFNLKNVLNVDF